MTMPNNTKDRDPTSSQPKLLEVQFDELLEDILGLSGRSIRTIKSLIFEPVHYFQAAKHPFWLNKYSPSFRIFFGLMAISTALKFFYASEDGALFRAFEGMISEQIAVDSEFLSSNGINPQTIDVKAIVQNSLQSFFLISTPLAIVFFLIIAFLFRSFGEPLRYVVRVRFLFSVLIPLGVITLISSISFVFLPSNWIDFVSNLTLVVSISVIGLTAYRGAFPEIASAKGRILRALGLTTLLSASYFLASSIAMGYGMYKSGYDAAHELHIAHSNIKKSGKEASSETDEPEAEQPKLQLQEDSP